ncbi:hypothetical protein Ancab_014258 [Ancistrocladus abbreviatus]
MVLMLEGVVGTMEGGGSKGRRGSGGSGFDGRWEEEGVIGGRGGHGQWRWCGVVVPGWERWVSLRKDRMDNQRLTLSSGQTWKFLSQIGVGGGVDSESMERRIEEMENRDANLYVKATIEPVAECAVEDNGLQ